LKPWQNEIMAGFLQILFKEHPNLPLYKTTVIRKYIEAGVPITWPRITPLKLHYEKKISLPPFT